MGCDIHAHVEVLMGTWLHYAEIDVERDYDLFTRMAGVRNTGLSVIAPIRGVPKDMSTITKLYHDAYGGHSFTWLYADEVSSAVQWAGKELFGDVVGYPWSVMAMGQFPEGVTDARLVFWFDS